MSEEDEEKRRPGVPKYYYWAKSPPKPPPYREARLSSEQKKFRLVVGAFTVAKILAVITFVLLIFGRL